MANYEDFRPNSDDAAKIYKQITTLLAGGAYSVEVLPNVTGQTVTLRVWYAAPYDLVDHHQIGGPSQPAAPLTRAVPGQPKPAKKPASRPAKKAAKTGTKKGKKKSPRG